MQGIFQFNNVLGSPSQGITTTTGEALLNSDPRESASIT
jgi:hypothetical protein